MVAGVDVLQNPLAMAGVDPQKMREEVAGSDDSKVKFKQFLADQKKMAFAMMQMANNPADMLNDGPSNGAADIMKAVTAMGEIMQQEFKLDRMGDKEDALKLQKDATRAAMVGAYSGQFVDVPVSTISLGEKVRFSLPEGVKKADLIIRRGEDIVYKRALEAKDGKGSFTWHGEQDNTDADDIVAGEAYKIELRALSGKSNVAVPLTGARPITKVKTGEGGDLVFKAGGKEFTPADLAKQKLRAALETNITA